MAQNNGIRVTRICHLTSVHTRSDTRIFLKQCRSLARAGYEVSLVVADGLGDEDREGVRIVDAGSSRGRVDRMIGATRRVLAKALAIDAKVYHLHAPELLPVGLRLKRMGKTVIFDAHEDLPRQVLSKPYLHPLIRGTVARTVAALEHFACPRFDAVIGATPAIAQKFSTFCSYTASIYNYPMEGELAPVDPDAQKATEVCYVGGINAIRGVLQVVEAMSLVRPPTRLNLAGGFVEAETRRLAQAHAGWPLVNELGFLSRQQVRDVLARSMAGIVTFLPEPNHVEAQPNKMFEYMSAGLPVIASNFPLWREIVEGNECGICVDPLDPSAIAAAIDTIAGNPELARHMGEKGRRAVEQRYNWAVEEKKLLDLYDRLLVPRTDAA